MVALGTMVWSGAVVTAQDFPTRPIRVVSAEPGGGNDFAARVVAQGLAGLGQPVIVENRPSGVIPGSIVAKAAPDGHTLLAYGVALWMAPFLQKDIPYDPGRDFAPVTLIGNSPLVLVVHPGVAAKSARELIALAKASPGQLNCASTSTGSPAHLAFELFKFMAGVDIVRISYKGGAPALIDVMSGRVHLAFGTNLGNAAHEIGQIAGPGGYHHQADPRVSRAAGLGGYPVRLRSRVDIWCIRSGQNLSGDHHPAEPRNRATSAD